MIGEWRKWLIIRKLQILVYNFVIGLSGTCCCSDSLVLL